jgi:hypothetical protein
LIRPNINGTGQTDLFHSMKGPMTTQTLRGMVANGAMHWRGDRATGFFCTDANSDPPFDSDLAFRNFIVAFEGLNGREAIISNADMQKFADFALDIILPPNPVRNLDNSLTAAQDRGKKFFFGCDGPDSVTTLPPLCINGRPLLDGGHRSDGLPFLPELGFTCEGCHTTEPQNGYFGTDWLELRGPAADREDPAPSQRVHQGGYVREPRGRGSEPGRQRPQGRSDPRLRLPARRQRRHGLPLLQWRGVQLRHHRPGQLLRRQPAAPRRRAVHARVRLGPAAGRRPAGHDDNTSRNDSNVTARVSLLEARCRANYASFVTGSSAKECDLVAKAIVGGVGKTYRLIQTGFYAGQYYENNTSTRRSATYVRDLANTASQPVTWTAVPYGSGTRVAGDVQ